MNGFRLSIVTALCAMSASAQQAKPIDFGAYKESGRFIFYAVLEGLYEDGISNEVVDAIIAPNGITDYDHSFVHGCPLCHPAFDAFQLYRGRKPLTGTKLRDTFGGGLTAEVRENLLSTDDVVRRTALQNLIERWVTRRMNLLRLTDAERAAFAEEMEKGREEGMKVLEAAQNSDKTPRYIEWDNCSVCDGAFGACEVPPAASGFTSRAN